MIKNKIAAFEPKQEAQQTYVAGLKSDLDKTVWKGNCSSWYVNKEGDVSVHAYSMRRKGGSLYHLLRHRSLLFGQALLHGSGGYCVNSLVSTRITLLIKQRKTRRVGMGKNRMYIHLTNKGKDVL